MKLFAYKVGGINKRLAFLILLQCAIVSPWYVDSANADAASKPRFTLPYVGGNLGLGRLDNDNYDDAFTLSGYGGFYLFHNASVEVWTVYLGEYDLKDTSDAYFTAGALAASFAYRIDIARMFALRPSVGVYYAESDIEFNGKKIGEDSGSDLMLGLTGVITIKEHVLININTHRFSNVSGSDIWVFSVGAGYQF